MAKDLSFEWNIQSNRQANLLRLFDALYDIVCIWFQH